MAARDELDRVGDHLARDERGAHPLRPHRDAVRDRDRVELHRRAAGVADAALDVLGELALVQVARHRLDPRRGDADERLRKVLVAEAGALQHRAGRSAVGAVGESGAVPLGGVGRTIVRIRHRAVAPVGVTCRGRIIASGKRSVSECRHSSPWERRAQTITVGPEPESVAPSAPGDGLARSSREQRRIRSAIRLVQAVVERLGEELLRRAGEGGAEQRGVGGGEGGVVVADGPRQRTPRLRRVDAVRRGRRRAGARACRRRSAPRGRPTSGRRRPRAPARDCRRGPRARRRRRAAPRGRAPGRPPPPRRRGRERRSTRSSRGRARAGCCR